MKRIDIQVVQRALSWLTDNQAVWLCTVIAAFGSAPRGPGSMLVALSTGESCGSLSGGYVEESFLQRIAANEFETRTQIIRYGDGGLGPNVALPCGGVLDVLVEYFPVCSDSIEHLRCVEQSLLGNSVVTRTIALDTGIRGVDRSVLNGQRVRRSADELMIQVGPAKRLVIAGLSPVAEYCAQFAAALDF